MTSVVDVASLSYKQIMIDFYLGFFMCVPLNLPVRWMVFSVAKVMSVVTRQTLRGCCNNYVGANGMLWITAE